MSLLKLPEENNKCNYQNLLVIILQKIANLNYIYQINEKEDIA